MKRGLSYAEAIDYAGVKRRTFDAMWRPRLCALHQGTKLSTATNSTGSSTNSTTLTVIERAPCAHAVQSRARSRQ